MSVYSKSCRAQHDALFATQDRSPGLEMQHQQQQGFYIVTQETFLNYMLSVG